MPIGLFENELTVQLWKPVTIRGYTFNVGDNLALDQNQIKKVAGRGRATSPGSTLRHRPSERDTPFESIWNRLPPPLLREGTQGPDPLARRCS